MTRTTAHLSRRLGIDPEGTLRWQDVDGLAYEVTGSRKHTGLSICYTDATQSQMPYQVNDYDQQPISTPLPMPACQTSEEYYTQQDSTGMRSLGVGLMAASTLLMVAVLYLVVGFVVSCFAPAPAGEARTEETTGRQSVALTSPVTR